ncbi:hypothetical protein [Chengkuizengella marina]|uniref:hypothetical protein n=1 Tax=Chengkuizengella marina TaxID=2507566 RepID=UPI00136ED2D9|nr:hypothetical protein [Chengkuizengella marina]
MGTSYTTRFKSTSRIQFVYKQMSAVGIGKQMREEFVIQKLKNLIIEVSQG